MKQASVVIVGGGLSGLYAALLLEKKGIDYILLEARPTLGGRIITTNSTIDKLLKSVHADATKIQATDNFDLGPSWFWPDFQQQLGQLIDELQLESFAQFEEGDMMVERSANERAMRSQGYKSVSPSMRLKGGMAALINVLYHRLNKEHIFTNQPVYQINKTDEHIDIISEDPFGQLTTWQAQQVLLALPPRLAATTIAFTPALPTELTTQWKNTATWMAPHAKYFAVYDTPFWRDTGLSGAARSTIGPLVEIHDASIIEGSGALFGFIGVPVQQRQSVSETVLKEHCRAQLVRLFGVEAGTPKAEYLKDWAQDSFTATFADLDVNADSYGQHASAPNAKASSGVWQHGLTGIGSEWSRQFSGYTAGAIDAASVAVQNLPECLLNLESKKHN